MPEKRFFIKGPLTVYSLFELTGEEAQHFKVMRCREGDNVEVINGEGNLAQAKVNCIGKRTITLEILSIKTSSNPNFEIILAQAIPKINRLDTILEKSTELGVSKIILFPAEFSEKKELSPNQLQRIENILIAATKQCGRLYLPVLELKPSLDKWAKPKSDALYFGDVSPNAPLFKNAWDARTNNAMFFVGPEQGLSEKEEKLLKGWDAKGVKLHSNILRTDTAPLTALSLISHFLMTE